ncbi:hypothetical protein ACRALDRAFT_2036762 [Sodiomyces alcalophilus JCM 7366]|uniref:uncharacterized protein n=1 Tax=Sodiomyces alcalophilus JCM 7366 TaxID=591952 RepID=UPI0039B4E5B9
MSPPRRRSARLASAANKLKPVSNLSSLSEHDESPQKDEKQNDLETGDAEVQQSPTTPVSSAIKPPMSEMHPSKVRPTTAGPSAAWLGFRDIQSADTSRGKTGGGNLQSTPSKSTGVPATPFTFHVSRAGPDLGLGSEAQRLMRELRDDAAKYKADLVAEREQEKLKEGIAQRKIAKARGQSGRFSAVHMARPSRLTPLKSALKRSPSKASLDETPRPKPYLKRTSSKADLDSDANSAKAVLGRPRHAGIHNSPSPVKRVRQQLGDDASTHRPVSREGTSIPRPKSSGKDGSTTLSRSRPNLAALLSPTKASAARTGPANSAQAHSPIKSSSRLAATDRLAGSSTSRGLNTLQRTVDLKRRIVSPGRFEKVKSILRGGKLDVTNGKSAIPQPSTATSKTPGPQAAERDVPPLPFTTPRRKLFKRVDFTPDTKGAEDAGEGEVNYPNLDAILSKMAAKEAEQAAAQEVPTTPRRLPEPPEKPGKSSLGSRTSGAFTFRSEKTIQFGSETPKGFGSSPGQASIRRVRPSVAPADDMPGSFPRGRESPRLSSIGKADPKPILPGVPHGLSNKKRARSDVEPSHANKENQAPMKPLNIPHGMPNKKRARASDDDDDDGAGREGEQRGGKRRKAEASPATRKLTVPKLGTTPKADLGRMRAGSHTPSPVKRRTGMTMSRLQMLAQPKSRR